MAPKRKQPIKCATCGAEFVPKRVTAKYCSDKCRYHNHLVTRKRIDLPRDLRFSILRRDKFQCLWCGATPEQKELRVDHVVPIAAGGARTDRANLVTACSDCNSGKSDMELDFDELPDSVLRVVDPDNARFSA